MKTKQLLTATLVIVASLTQAQSLSLDTSYSGSGSHQHGPWWNGQNQNHQIMDMVPVSNDYTLTLFKSLNFNTYTNSSEIRRQEASSGAVSNNVYYDWTIPNTEVIASSMDKTTSGVVAGARIYPSTGTPQVQLIKFTLDLNTTGTLDNSFGNAGVVSFPQPIDGDLEPVRILERSSDAYLYVVSQQYITGTIKRKIVITRLNENGALDTSFGTGGHVFHEIGDSTYAVNDAIIDGSDNLYICGGAFKYEIGSEGGLITTRKSFVTKVLPDGSIDQNYGDNGSTRFTFSDLFTQYSTSITLKFVPGGGILVFGSGTHQSNTRPGLAKLDDSGILESNFGTNGILKSHFNQNRVYLSDGEVLNNGTILVSATYQANQFDPSVPAVFTLDANGAILTSAHPEGYFSFGGEFDSPQMMSRTPEDKILIHGFHNMDTGLGGVEYQLKSFRLNNEDVTLTVDEMNALNTQLYPNPTTEYLQTNYDKELEYKIIDITGKVVAFGVLDPNDLINVSDLKRGVYIMKCVLENDQVVTRRIIKN